LTLACIATISQPIPTHAVEPKSNSVVTVPIKPGYADFWWGELFQNANRDLILSYTYRLGSQWESHYVNVDTAIDLDPADAPKIAADNAAARKLERTFRLHPIAADIFQTFDLPHGSRLAHGSMLTGSCGWPYPDSVSIRSKDGMTEELALFVRAREPRQVTLTHECERSRGTDKVWLKGVAATIQTVAISPRSQPSRWRS
jgi:hypothetical protein